MKFIEFKKSLNEKIEPIYIFYGEDRYLIDNCLKNLIASCEIELPELNLSILDNGTDINEIINSCETLPFMDKLRLTIIKDMEFNENIKSKITKYASKPNTSACLAFTTKSEPPAIENVVKVDCGKLDATMIRKKLLADLTPKGYMISDEAIKALISYCDYSMTKIYSELDKLMAYATNKTIKSEMIQTLCVKDLSYSIFELTDALGKKDSEQAIKILSSLVKNEDLIGIIATLYGHFRRLFIVSITSPSVDNISIANSMGVKPYAIQVARQQAKYFSRNKLMELCEKLQAIDLRVKTNFSNTENELFSFVFSALN